ncbi:MAG: hypothetical protein C5B59_09650 [Bacteroidetes bacterium]|nr:MAG: hypothetical protein C5B59_09650 [Bacteroidota bacterium]
MKRLFIILLSLGLVSAASAQRSHLSMGGGGGYHYYVRPHVSVVYGGYAPFYPYYGFGYGYSPFGYAPFGYYPYVPYGCYNRPSKLTMEIEGIKSDYRDKISSARHDKGLTHDQRKEKVHELKLERDQLIADTKSNYYKSKN